MTVSVHELKLMLEKSPGLLTVIAEQLDKSPREVVLMAGGGSLEFDHERALDALTRKAVK